MYRYIYARDDLQLVGRFIAGECICARAGRIYNTISFAMYNNIIQHNIIVSYIIIYCSSHLAVYTRT